MQGQGWEPGYGDGWNGESATPHMGWRSWNSFRACISADKSNCSFPKERSGQGQRVGLRHACRTCGTIASAIDGVTARKWKVAGKTVSLADVGCKNGHQRPGCHSYGPMLDATVMGPCTCPPPPALGPVSISHPTVAGSPCQPLPRIC